MILVTEPTDVVLWFREVSSAKKWCVFSEMFNCL